MRGHDKYRFPQTIEKSLEMVAGRDVCVLITGESGTGKEVAARRLHEMSRRARGPFLAVDCTTLRDTLFESQMFGHERGSFTGADRTTVGFARAANGGSLLLDEIGELDPTNQARMLRLIQDREVTPLGSTRAVRVDIRILAATHRDLWAMASEGRFRFDLLYRIDVVRIELPALRERLDEIPLLVGMFVEEVAASYGEAPVSVSDAAMRHLCAYSWPGNLRELRNVVEHAFVFADGEIEPRHLPERIRRRERIGTIAEFKPLADMEAEWIRSALARTGGNKTEAARLLGISRSRLLRAVSRSA